MCNDFRFFFFSNLTAFNTDIDHTILEEANGKCEALKQDNQIMTCIFYFFRFHFTNLFVYLFSLLFLNLRDMSRPFCLRYFSSFFLIIISLSIINNHSLKFSFSNFVHDCCHFSILKKMRNK